MVPAVAASKLQPISSRDATGGSGSAVKSSQPDKTATLSSTRQWAKAEATILYTIAPRKGHSKREADVHKQKRQGKSEMRLLLAPARQQMVFDAQLIADSANDEIDGVLQRLRADIEGRHGRQHHGTGLCTRGQIAELNKMQRRLARHQNEWTAFFQVNVGGAMDEVLRQTMSDGGRRTHAARTNDHACRQERATSDASLEVHEMMIANLAGIEPGGVAQQIGEDKAIQANAAI